MAELITVLDNLKVVLMDEIVLKCNAVFCTGQILDNHSIGGLALYCKNNYVESFHGTFITNSYNLNVDGPLAK